MDKLLSRLRLATAAELDLLEGVLEFKPSQERELRLAALHDKYLSLANAKTSRDALVAAMPLAAKDAGWTAPKPSTEAEDAWIEEYLYWTMCFTHHKKPTNPSDEERAEAQERAEAALHGKIDLSVSVMGQTLGFAASGAVAIAGSTAAGALLATIGLPVLVLGGVTLLGVGVGSLFDGPSPKLLPATLILVHVRKRVEFTQFLDSGSTQEVA